MIVKVAPAAITTGFATGSLRLNVPPLEAVHWLTWVIVCVVPAQFAHAGWLVIAFVPFTDAPHVRPGLVVTDAWLVVPAAPGSPTSSQP